MIFPDDFTFVGVNTSPRVQYELDRLTRSWKANGATEEDVLSATGLPQVGDQHPIFPNMYVVSLSTNETGSSACALDVAYIGTIQGSEGSPTLPATRHVSGGQVSSATTNTDADIFPGTVTNPLTVQFYAITNTIVYYSNDPADAAEPDDPPEVDQLITWDLGFGVQPGFSFPDLVTYFLTSAYVQGLIETPPDIDEVVAGQFYKITKKKTRTLFPYAPPS